MELWPHQVQAAVEVMDWIPTDEKRILFAAPTGSGKTKAMEEVRRILPGNSLLVSPTMSILRGFYREATGEEPPAKEPVFRDACWELGMATPLWLRNRLDTGEVLTDDVEFIVLDEAHHGTADTYQLIEAYNPQARWIGFTATPYRGTPSQTAELLRQWGPAHVLLSYPEANGPYITLPDCYVVPLVDDDNIKVIKGKFADAAVTRATEDAMASLLDLIDEVRVRNFGPTMLAVPTREILWDLVSKRKFLVGIDANTKFADRVQAFEDVVANRKMLVQISAASEGVDLPLRCLLDARPMYSPVSWCQTVGRITRLATDHRPMYICTNRNVERHAYIWEGAIQKANMAQAQNAFDVPSKRSLHRALGLEILGSRKPTKVVSASEVIYSCVPLAHTDKQGRTTEWLAIVDPTGGRDTWFTKHSTVDPNGKRDYGKWQIAPPPETLSGYKPGRWTSGPLSEKQEVWYNRGAHIVGFHPSMAGVIDRKGFNVFAALTEVGLRLP